MKTAKTGENFNEKAKKAKRVMSLLTELRIDFIVTFKRNVIKISVHDLYDNPMCEWTAEVGENEDD